MNKHKKPVPAPATGEDPYGPDTPNYQILNEAHRARPQGATATKRAKSPKAPDTSQSDESNKRLP